MNSKSVYKYQLNDFKKPIMVFYLVIACVFALIFLSMGTMLFKISFNLSGNQAVEANVSSLEFASIIFLFVAGLNTFRESFRFSMQNGVSRKSVWSGTVLSFLTVSGAMALMDTVIRIVLINIVASRYNVKVQGLYDLLTGLQSTKDNMFQNVFEGFLLNVCLYTAALSVGYFITVGYYRMNKIAKIIVSIGVPGLYIFVLPFADVFIFKGALTNAIMSTVKFSYGGMNGDNPYFAMGSGLLISAAFLGLTYLMVRRAPIKD